MEYLRLLLKSIVHTIGHTSDIDHWVDIGTGRLAESFPLVEAPRRLGGTGTYSVATNR